MELPMKITLNTNHTIHQFTLQLLSVNNDTLTNCLSLSPHQKENKTMTSTLKHFPIKIYITTIVLWASATTAFTQNYVLDQYQFIDQMQQSNHWVDSVFQTLSPKERIAQLFMVDAYSNLGEKETKRIEKIITKYQIGGIIFFQGSPAKQAALTNKYQQLAKVPLWIGMDAETGLGMRLKQTIKYPKEMTLGAITNNSLIYELGKQMGEECRTMGVHVNFSPVADINCNPQNPVINMRSFGENRYNVAKKSHLLAMGMQHTGVVAVGKHFPGHGDTNTDSHVSLPTIKHHRQRLDSIELYPFKKMIQQGVSGIMVSHLNVPALDSVQKVATLSRPIVTGLLRDKMNFKGLIFTDALNMRGVRNHYKKGEITVKALLAGNDVLLFPEDVAIALEVMQKAIESGKVAQSTIDAKCKKILRAKYWIGLNQYHPIESDGLWSKLNTPKGFLLRRQLIESSITIIQNKKHLLPIERLDTLKIAVVAMGAKKRNRFQEYLSQYTKVDCFQISNKATLQAYQNLEKKLDKYNLIIVSKHRSTSNAKRQFGSTNQNIKFIQHLSQKKAVVFTYFGNPYALNLYPTENISSIVVAYEDNLESQMAAAQVVFGGLPAKGILPVSINSHFVAGIGIFTKKTRLAYGTPESEDMSSNQLKGIDSLVENAIKKEAIPGCQVLIARNGRVIFNKNYGYHTYAKKTPVHGFDIYDLASLTKISATLPALMQLYEKGKIDINKTLGTYYNKVENTNKDTLILKDILAHQAQLPSWIPFHWQMIDSSSFNQDLFSKRYSSRYRLKVAPRLYMDKNYKFIKGVFAAKKSNKYSVQVANNLYLNKAYRDTIMNRIYNSDLNETAEYKYSDLGFIMMADMLKNITGKPINRYIQNNVFARIGANNLSYLPLKKFRKKRIIPTQNDKFFRHQLLRGYVHDPTAALLGGVSGNAGLFGNANDLAKLMQMYLQNGRYGNQQIIADTIVKRFTARAFPKGENRRGIGFDKPFVDIKEEGGPTCSLVSPLSYGHTGFTGTMAWVDPQYNLVYLFLSNRINPNEWNNKLMKMDVRTDIQEVIYKAILPASKKRNEVVAPQKLVPFNKRVSRQ